MLKYQWKVFCTNCAFIASCRVLCVSGQMVSSDAVSKPLTASNMVKTLVDKQLIAAAAEYGTFAANHKSESISLYSPTKMLH